MPATQAGHLQAHRHIGRFGLHRFIFYSCSHVHAARAAHDELTHRFIVQVQQDIARQRVARQVVHPIHASLLVRRDQCLNRPMLQRPVFEHGHDGCHAHAIIRPQRGALGLHPLAVHVCFDGIILKIMRTV